MNDPETAEALCPKDHFYGTKRPCLDTNYYETFNLPHVRLVDLRKTPITTITETGIDTSGRVVRVRRHRVRHRVRCHDRRHRRRSTSPAATACRWPRSGRDGPKTYLGLTSVGFPNLFLITGPGSPSVLSNMAVSIEQHVEWVSDCIQHLRDEGLDVIEPTPTAEAGWVQHVNDCADITLFPTANSWYMGANVPGKPRVFLPYIGGVDTYRKACDEVVSTDYLGLRASTVRAARAATTASIRRLQPDVQIVLDVMAELGPAAARVDVGRTRPGPSRRRWPPSGRPAPRSARSSTARCPGAAGDLDYRLYRPATPGPAPRRRLLPRRRLGARQPRLRRPALPRPVRALRHASSCRSTTATHPRPASRPRSTTGSPRCSGSPPTPTSSVACPGRLAVCGWSAGANLAAVVCQLARDAGGPAIVGQVLLTPVTDCDLDAPVVRRERRRVHPDHAG